MRKLSGSTDRHHWEFDVMAARSKQEKRTALFRFWLAHGLSVRACTALSLAGCRSTADIRKRGYRYFATLDNCGKVTLHEIETLIGCWPAPRQRGKPQGDLPANVVVLSRTRAVSVS